MYTPSLNAIAPHVSTDQRADFTPAPSPRSLAFTLVVASAAPHIYYAHSDGSIGQPETTHISKSPVLTGDACLPQGVLIHADGDLRDSLGFPLSLPVMLRMSLPALKQRSRPVQGPQAHMGPVFINRSYGRYRSRACQDHSNARVLQMKRLESVFSDVSDHAVP